MSKAHSLIDTWPQGSGGAEPAHLIPDGQGTLEHPSANHGTTNQRPVTDRRLAFHTTPGTTPPNTGAELCAQALPTREEQKKGRFLTALNFVLLNETWRTEQEEFWITEQDHLFAGCGHPSGRRGVGILLYKRWRKHVIAFKPITERMCYILGCKNLRDIISPHIGLLPR